MITAVALGRAIVTITLTATLSRSVEVTDADLHPGHLTTVWWDEACGCRRVVVEAREPIDAFAHVSREEVADGG